MNDFESYDDFIDFINPFTPYKFIAKDLIFIHLLLRMEKTILMLT